MSLTLKNLLHSIQKEKFKNSKDPAVKNLEQRYNLLNLRLCCLIDISGSISAEIYRKFMAQLNAIRGLSTVMCIENDSEICSVYNYFKCETNKIVKLGGGGGTDLEPGFKKAISMKPDCVLVLSDGYDNNNLRDPGIPVACILTSGGVEKWYPFMKHVERLK